MNDLSYWFAREAAMYARDVDRALSEVAYAICANDQYEVIYWSCVAMHYECLNMLYNAASKEFYIL